MRNKFLMTAVVAVAIIALVGAVAAITVAAVGNGASYAFWSQANDIVSTETSNTTALAEDINPSEKYIVYDYYVIEGNVWDPTKQWTRLAKLSESPDENNISRPVFNASDGATADANGITNIKAVAVKYTGNISTLNVPDTTPVFIGQTQCNAEVVEIESLNRETSPGVAIVDKLIIGRNVKAMGYSRGTNGVIIKSGMSGFRSLREVVIARNGTGSDTNGMYSSFDKITAVGHFFEDSPNVTSMWALVYSNLNLQGVDKDKVPQKMPLTWAPDASKQYVDAFCGQTVAPKDYMETGIGVNHAIEDGFKRCADGINLTAAAGFTIYKDTLKTVADGGVMTYSSGVYSATIGGTNYLLVRNGNGEGEVRIAGSDVAVGRFEYAARTVIVTLYELKADGTPETDELGIVIPKAKYYY